LIWIVVQIIAWFIVFPAFIQGMPFTLTSLDIFRGLLFFLYAAVLESTWGTTIGKQIMNLRVTMLDGKPATFDRTLLRNLSKIHGLLFLIDLVVGMATVGDPHQKISDRYAGTTVVSTMERTMILPLPPSPPTPPSPP